jgi:hypothetical protein
MKGASAACIALLIGMTTSASAIECASAPAGRAYWSWRQIDGKRCWYQGHRRLNKSVLHWGAPVAATGAPPKLSPRPAQIEAEAGVRVPLVWPPFPAADFNSRFDAIRDPIRDR